MAAARPWTSDADGQFNELHRHLNGGHDFDPEEPSIIRRLPAGVAQSVEQLIRNEKVGCSIHLSGTNTSKGLLLLA